jgi:hypothetical protein
VFSCDRQTPSDGPDRSQQLVAQGGPRHFTGAEPGDHDEIGSRRQESAQEEPKTFADPPLDAIAHHRAADPARDGHPEANVWRGRCDKRVNHKVRGLHANPAALRADEFTPPM